MEASTQTKHKRSWLKWLLILASIGIVTIAITIWYIFTVTFSDTAGLKPDYDKKAMDLISEFQQNDSSANHKYAEKIITVRGIVSAIESADTTINIKMTDTTSGAYIIFAFQQQHLAEAKKIKEGDSIAVKGSCSGGAYSEILEIEYITFKRSTITR